MATAKSGDRPPTGRCPICTAPIDAHYRPFCSKRCADIDLSRWLRGGYVIVGGNADADEDGDDTIARKAIVNPDEVLDEDE